LVEKEAADDEAAIPGSAAAAGAGDHVLDTIWVSGGDNGSCYQESLSSEWYNDCWWDWMVLLDEILQGKEVV